MSKEHSSQIDFLKEELCETCAHKEFCGEDANIIQLVKCEVYAVQAGILKSTATNADRIRSMTDEELAEWLNDMQGYSFSCGLIEARISEYPNRYNAWLEWLKEEAKE